MLFLKLLLKIQKIEYYFFSLFIFMNTNKEAKKKEIYSYLSNYNNNYKNFNLLETYNYINVK